MVTEPTVPEEPFVKVSETHAGVVFLIGDRAYKLKKPVSFGFLDFSSRELRQRDCAREVELNSRLAPDVYLGVADVIGPDGAPWDHLVVMRRMPDDRRLARLAGTGAALEGDLRRLAELLADFHRSAERSPAIEQEASRDAVLARWEANERAMRQTAGPAVEAATAAQVMDLARRYLAGREPLFSARIASGRACDGHGDLLADDIFFGDEGPRVLDCLEFDDRLRYGDVLADLAFLAMDLERIGRPDLGVLLLDHYRSVTSDDWPASLAHHYIAYRAQVRALVAALRAEQGDAASADGARRLLGLAVDHLKAGTVRLVVVGGPPGSGKSTLAAGIAAAVGAATIRSDEVRKELAGMPPSAAAPAPMDEGLYRPEVTAATYEEMMRRARERLGMGESVVLDATFADTRWREAARALASQEEADLGELSCHLDPSLLHVRLAERRAAGGDPSDADVEIARHLAARHAPWPTAATVDTSGPAVDALGSALDHLGVPAGGDQRP